jgi:CheY-like chemotaxis protein
VNLTHGDWDAALIVRGDPQRLQQVVTILLTNAIKFTPNGGTVDLSLKAERGAARVVVHDSGMGIPIDQIEAIFERFKQVGGQAIREKGGLGLGLSIVKHVVDAHQGTVCARIHGPGTGSQLEMTLPLAVAADTASSHTTADALADTETLAGVRVLVVDDEESARTVIAASLKKAGATVLSARSAAEAWNLLSTQPVDVIVSDVGMPGENGLELIARIRQSNKPFKALPALALTGFASVDDQTRALSAGFQMHAAKPVEPQDLARRIATICRQSRSG